MLDGTFSRFNAVDECDSDHNDGGADNERVISTLVEHMRSRIASREDDVDTWQLHRELNRYDRLTLMLQRESKPEPNNENFNTPGPISIISL